MELTCIPLVSDPTQKDSDYDNYDDAEDKHPFTPYAPVCIDMITKLESMIDDFYNEDYAGQLIADGRVTREQNSIVAMNIIRSVKYGDKYDSIGSDIDKLKWDITCRRSFDTIRMYIETKAPLIMSYFKDKKEKDDFVDPYDNKIDFLHLMATLSGQNVPDDLITLLIPRQLSGWAGDLQSLIFNLKEESYGTSKDLNDLAANQLIGKDGTYFSEKDILADLDAENIYHLYHISNRLSIMLSNYYTFYCRNRYTLFVHYYEGIEDLEKTVNDFTQNGFGIIKYYILNKKAGEFGASDRAISVYNEKINSGIELPKPEVVTNEESKALAYAFMNYIRRRL